MPRPLSSFLACRCVAGAAAATLVALAAAQPAPVARPSSAPVGNDYRSGTVPAVGPDVDLSNTGGAASPAPAGASTTTGDDTAGATSVGRPPMGGFGPTVRSPAVPTGEAASATAPAPAPRRHRRKEGTGPDGTRNPGGKGVVIISPQ